MDEFEVPSSLKGQAIVTGLSIMLSKSTDAMHTYNAYINTFVTSLLACVFIQH